MIVSANTVRQFLRFATSGGVVTLLAASIYWVLAQFVMTPVAGNLCGWVLATMAGYFLHRHWSFRGHAQPGQLARTTWRFLVVSLLALAMNTFFVWIITGPALRGPIWVSVLPLVFVTPLFTFALNREWVFRSDSDHARSGNG